MTTKRQTRSDETRDRILQAAIQEFSEHGLAGARTGAIAAAAQVNKALLYYYFRDKEGLYVAALEAVSGRVAENALALLRMDCSPGERMLRFTLQHFDRILSQRGFQALMQQEMVRFREGHSDAMRIIAKNAFEPMFRRAEETVLEGIRSGELCQMDWMQMIYAALGANVFYFLSAPMIQLMSSFDLFEPAVLAARRTAAIQFMGQAIFVDRKHGARLAAAVLAAMPLPETSSLQQRKTA